MLLQRINFGILERNTKHEFNNLYVRVNLRKNVMKF